MSSAARKHLVRIIGGQWKRTPLTVPELEGLRPTPDRVRETLFNWLGQDLAGKQCLDLFAGTGALGFEAASRGAARVVSVDAHRAAAAAIRQTIAKLNARQIEFHQADALAMLTALERAGERFDLVFLDPPFRQDWLARVLPRVIGLLAPDGAIYVESETALDAAPLQAQGLHLERAAAAGQVHYHLLTSHPRSHAPD